MVALLRELHLYAARCGAMREIGHSPQHSPVHCKGHEVRANALDQNARIRRSAGPTAGRRDSGSGSSSRCCSRSSSINGVTIAFEAHLMNAKQILWPALVASLALVGACSKSKVEDVAPRTVADTIYVGGDIVTLNDAQPTAEALAVKDGKILAVGRARRSGVGPQGRHHQSRGSRRQDLAPGFLDTHSHYVSALSVANQVNVYAPPAGPGKDVPSIIAAIEQFRARAQIPKGQLIQAYGYDDTVMPDGRLLNRDDLDAAFPDNPVLVGHVSMHGAVMNSAALQQFGISAATRTPPGGVIVRKPGSDEPYGLIMETAYLPVFANLPQPTTGAGDRVQPGGPDAVRRSRGDHRPRRRHPRGGPRGDAARHRRRAPTSSTSSPIRSSPISTRY